MNRERRRDLVELIGLTAILVSLVVLIVEVRQNTNALYAESRQAVLESTVQDLNLLFENPEIVSIIINPQPLTAEEQIRLDTYWAASLKAREYVWLQYNDGVIDSDLFNSELAVLRVVFDSSKARTWWSKLGRQYFSEEFIAFVEEEMERTPATDTVWKDASIWNNE